CARRSRQAFDGAAGHARGAFLLHFDARFLYFVAWVFPPSPAGPILLTCRRVAVEQKENPMPLPDELEQLNALHERGALTDEEFALAKKRLLEGAPDPA